MRSLFACPLLTLLQALCQLVERLQPDVQARVDMFVGAGLDIKSTDIVVRALKEDPREIKIVEQRAKMERQQLDIVQHLLRRKANPNMQRVWTAVRSKMMVELLLNEKADPTSPDSGAVGIFACFRDKSLSDEFGQIVLAYFEVSCGAAVRADISRHVAEAVAF